eukprot:symbB.v1.2.017015.t2/scaffold1316.1/size125546/5
MEVAQVESFSQRIAQCLLWEKVKEGHVHLITTEDIEELFHAFEYYDADLPTSELVRLCGVDGTHLSADDIAEWIKDSDKDGTGEVSIKDVHRGITEGAAAFSLVKRALFGEEKEHKITECSIHELLGWMHYEYDKKSKLWLSSVRGSTTLYGKTVTSYFSRLWTLIRIGVGCKERGCAIHFAII